MVWFVGINLELSKDNDESSKEPIDWGVMFSLLIARGFSHTEILNLSYPQFNAYMNAINNPLSYPVVIPYLGGNEEDLGKNDENNFGSVEELLGFVANMNNEFM